MGLCEMLFYHPFEGVVAFDELVQETAFGEGFTHVIVDFGGYVFVYVHEAGDVGYAEGSCVLIIECSSNNRRGHRLLRCYTLYD